MSPQRIDPCTSGYACGQCHSKAAAPAPPLPPAHTQSLLAGAPPLKYAAAPQPKANRPRKKVATASILLDDMALFMALGMAIALAGRVRGGGAVRSRAPDSALEMMGEDTGGEGEEQPLLGRARA